MDARCYHCGEPIRPDLVDGAEARAPPDLRLIHLGLPSVRWWKEIITTCGNTRVFFAYGEHRTRWRAAHPIAAGGDPAIDLILQLIEPLYGG